MPTMKQTDFAFHQPGQVLRELETDLRWGLGGWIRVPVDWHRLAQEPQAPAKTTVTLRIDEDVMKFFRAMGPGHLTRMNAVLRAFMLARLAEVVKDYKASEPTLKDKDDRIRDELHALLQGEKRAEKEAEDQLALAAKYFPKLKSLNPIWDARMKGAG